MKKILLFSNETPSIMPQILDELFPKQLKPKIFAYIPSDGANQIKNEKYAPVWRQYAKEYGVDEFLYIDNSKSQEESLTEHEKVMSANIVLLTGGSTFTFLRNMKRSGLDEVLKQFVKKSEYVLAGFSAGAMILTPNINLCNMEGFDENKVGLNDLTGLSIVDFEVFPHFDTRSAVYEDYLKTTTNEIRTIADNQMIVIKR